MSKHGSTRQAIYQYITEYIKLHSIPPTVREIGAALGIVSTSTVHGHIKKLQEEGLIDMSPAKQRSITVTAFSDGAYDASVSNAAVAPAEGFARIPLVGRVAAGIPILAEENVQEFFNVPAIMLRGASSGDVFMLTVSGESMIDVGINDGDIIIVDRGKSYSNGDIVVARVDSDTATVKRLFINKDDTVRLQPENSTMPPIIVKKSQCEVIGRLIGLYRNY